jgi:hypothetical protein
MSSQPHSDAPPPPLGLEVISYADDLTLLGTFASIRMHFPTLLAYLRHLGLKVNPDKSLWYLCSADPALQEQLARLIADLRRGEVATSLIQLLGAALRVGSALPLDDWTTPGGAGTAPSPKIALTPCCPS